MSPRKRPSCDGAPRRNWAARLPAIVLGVRVGRRPGALARYLLDHAEVDACDIDPFAIAAIRINAAANGVAWLPKANLVGRASAGTWRNA